MINIIHNPVGGNVQNSEIKIVESAIKEKNEQAPAPTSTKGN